MAFNHYEKYCIVCDIGKDIIHTYDFLWLIHIGPDQNKIYLTPGET